MTQTSQRLGQQAVVIGGSMTGLLAARVLSDHFDQVTIIERDVAEDSAKPRKGVPQGAHVHVLFSGGINVIDELFPQFSDELAASGSYVCDFSQELCWYHAGVWKARPDADLISYWQTRPFLESHLRRRVTNDTDVVIRQNCYVTKLLASEDHQQINGVEIHCADSGESETITADLVIDASGRGSQVPKWIEAIGYDTPEEKLVEVNIGYASRVYQPPEDDSRDWQIMAQYGTPPQSTRTGYIFPIEGGRWMVSAVGFLNDHAPTDEEGYLAFAKSMERPDFYEAIRDAEPVTPISTYTFTANQWRRYDRLARFPGGLLVIGDANSTFNPVYGQGMSAGALQVQQLRLLLQECDPVQGIPPNFFKKFFRRTAKIIEIPWMLATQSDFQYPGTRGKRPLRTRPLNWYLVRVLRLCNGNDRITELFYNVLHFNKKPTAFFHPAVIGQVLLRATGLSRSKNNTKQRPSISG